MSIIIVSSLLYRLINFLQIASQNGSARLVAPKKLKIWLGSLSRSAPNRTESLRTRAASRGSSFFFFKPYPYTPNILQNKPIISYILYLFARANSTRTYFGATRLMVSLFKLQATFDFRFWGVSTTRHPLIIP